MFLHITDPTCAWLLIFFVVSIFFSFCFCFQKHKEDRKSLQYCDVCKGYKAPRSHHCKTCGQLVNVVVVVVYYCCAVVMLSVEPLYLGISVLSFYQWSI